MQIHIISICFQFFIRVDFWVYDYGGSSIVAFTFWAEISNPFYLRRNLYKRIGMENTMKYQFFLWAYAAVFIYCRAYLFIFICKDAMESTKPPVVLKFFACLFVFVSQGWLVFLFGILWKSLPNWFPNPDKIRNEARWWKSVRQTYTALTRKNPGYAIILSVVTIISFLTPFSYGLYCTFKG